VRSSAFVVAALDDQAATLGATEMIHRVVKRLHRRRSVDGRRDLCHRLIDFRANGSATLDVGGLHHVACSNSEANR
jgi:hypothetical protein